MAKGKEGTVNVNYVVNGEIIGSVPVTISETEDNFIEAILKKISQAFLSMIQLIEFVFEKIRGKLA